MLNKRKECRVGRSKFLKYDASACRDSPFDCISGRFFALAHALAIAYVATSQPFRDRERDHPKGSKGYRDWK